MNVPFPILWQDRHLVVIDKPSGVAVAPTRQGEDSVATRTGLLVCHRLDVETSGCLALARSAAGHRLLNLAFSEGRVRKTYLAVARAGGEVPEEGVVELAIGDWRRGRVTVGEGKPARTRWRRAWQDGERVGLEVWPETGRTHQIRAHLAAIGLPLWGDPTYGGPRDGRVLLHARRLALPWPDTSALTTVEAPIPTDFGWSAIST